MYCSKHKNSEMTYLRRRPYLKPEFMCIMCAANMVRRELNQPNGARILTQSETQDHVAELK